MIARSWLPSAWMDEVSPSPSASPDDFLKRNTAGVLQLAPVDDDSDWLKPEDIEEGAEIGFYWCEQRGTSTLTIHADGTWTVDPPFPTDANTFVDAGSDYETDLTIEGLVQAIADTTPGLQTIEVEAWTWSDEILLQVRVLESGAASFVPVPVSIPDAGHPYGLEHPVVS